MDVEADITALYALPLDEFVAARNDLAKRAKLEVAADLATSIKALRKPTTTAWLANQLARQHGDTVASLVDLGAQMREATAARDGARLRELTARRKELVDDLLTAGAGLARGAQVGWSDDVTTGLGETFHAALADPDAGEELRAGRLSRALENVGFGPVLGEGEAAEVISLSRAREARRQQAPSSGADSGRTKPAQRTDESPKPTQQQRTAQAQAELDDAQAAVEAADDHVDDLTVELDRRRRALDDAESAVQRLKAELDAARTEVDGARADVDAGQEQLDRAQVDAETTRGRRREAKQRLARLRDERLGRT